MKKNGEKGITIVTLVITIVILLILAGIGTASGINTLEMGRYTQLKNELKIIQTKVNELNSQQEIDIGQELNTQQKEYLENTYEIKQIIFNGIDIETNEGQEQKEDIIQSFRFLNKLDIKNELQQEGIKREYLISVKYRYVVCYPGVEYKGKTYYMINQIENGLYNVNYNSQNSSTQGNYEIEITKENNKWKIEIVNIEYNGYIKDWQVKYKLDINPYWETSEDLVFYIREPGNYIIKLIHKDEVELEEKQVTIVDEYIQNNLILQYDAINRSGDIESISSNNWADISGNNNNATIYGATWNENYLSFDGIDDYAVTNYSVDYDNSKEITVELVSIGEALVQNDTSKTQILIESSNNWSLNYNAYAIDLNEFGNKKLATIFHTIKGNNIQKTMNEILAENVVNLYTIVINNTSEGESITKIYVNGELQDIIEQENNIDNINEEIIQSYPIYIASRAGTSYFTKIDMGALRIYNKELTQEQILYNYEIDKVRFRKR